MKKKIEQFTKQARTYHLFVVLQRERGDLALELLLLIRQITDF